MFRGELIVTTTIFLLPTSLNVVLKWTKTGQSGMGKTDAGNVAVQSARPDTGGESSPYSVHRLD